MKTGLYKSVEFCAQCPLAEAKARLQEEGQSNSHKWWVEVQGDRFRLMPVSWDFFASYKVFWPKVEGFLAAQGTDTAVRLTFRPTAETWVAGGFALLVTLAFVIYTLLSGWPAATIAAAVMGVILLLLCLLMVRWGKKSAVETARRLLERK